MTILKKYNFYILIFYILVAQSSLAQVAPQRVNFDLKNNWSCLQDHAQFLPIYDTYLSPQEAHKRSLQFDDWSEITVGQRAKELWVKFTVVNDYEDEKRFYLNGQYFDYIKLYEIVDKEPKSVSSSGYMVPFNQRPVKEWGTVVCGVLPGKTAQTYLLVYRSITTNSQKLMSYVTVPCMKLYSRQGFDTTYVLPGNFLYFFLGGILMMALYNLGISISTMYREYLLFSMYNMITFLSTFIVTGQHIELELIGVFDYERNLKYIIPLLITPSYTLFALKFLDLHSINKKADTILKYLAVLIAVPIVGLLLSQFNFAFYSFSLLTAVIFTLILGFSIKSAMTSLSARFFLGGNLLICSASLLQLGSLFTLITTTQLITASFIMVMLEIITFSFAVAYKLKTSRRAILDMRYEAGLHQEKLKLAEETQQTLQTLLEEKSRALASSSVQWLHIDDQLSKLTKVINQKYKEENPKMCKKIIKQINNLKSFEDQWNMFKIHFESVHPGFFSSLEEKYPNLSQNDLKVCAFMKMKLSNKEIAAILNVTGKAVEQVRRRMRKKIGLPPEHDILKHIEGKIGKKDQLFLARS